MSANKYAEIELLAHLHSGTDKTTDARQRMLAVTRLSEQLSKLLTESTQGSHKSSIIQELNPALASAISERASGPSRAAASPSRKVRRADRMAAT